jgi:probable HAF family extracellular repeat protein
MRTVLILGALSVCLLNASPIYRVIDLGTLGGASAATGLNSWGDAAGWSLVGSQSMRALETRRSGGEAQSLDPTRQSRATGINDAGQVTGIRYDTLGDATAVLWQADGTAVMLGEANSYAMAINSSGVVAGAASGRAVRFAPDGGGAVSVGVNAARWSSANAINDAAAVAGTAQLSNGAFRAFTASASGPATLLGTLGGTSSYGQGINAAGWVVGGSTTVNGYLHAFLYASGGRLRDLGTFNGGANSSAYDVNDLGQVVGYSQRAGGAASAFLWEDGRLLDLNELIAAQTGWRLMEASGINNNGQIVGFGILAGVQRAFRLDPIETVVRSSDFSIASIAGAAPIPEPGSWVLAAIGLAGILFGVFRRTYFN